MQLILKCTYIIFLIFSGRVITELCSNQHGRHWHCYLWMSDIVNVLSFYQMPYTNEERWGTMNHKHMKKTPKIGVNLNKN